MKEQKNWKVMLLNLDVVIAAVAMCILVGLTFTGVIARYVVNRPFAWIEEVQAALIVWVIFGAAGAAFRTANHAAIEVFYEMFPNAVKTVINVIILIVSVITLGFLGYNAVKYIEVFTMSGRTTPILHFSYKAIFCIVPVSCVWQIVNFILVNFFHYSEQEVIESITDEEFEEAKKK